MADVVDCEHKATLQFVGSSKAKCIYCGAIEDVEVEDV